MAARWYVEKNGQVLGPLTTPQLRQRVAAGELGPGDKVRREDMANWARAAAVKGLFDAVAPPTGPTATPPTVETMAPPPAAASGGNPFDFFGLGTPPPSAELAPDHPAALEHTGAFAFDEGAPAAPAPPATLAAAPPPPPVTKPAKPKPKPAAPKVEEIIPAALPVDDDDDEKFAAIDIAELVPTASPLSSVMIAAPKPPPGAGFALAEISGAALDANGTTTLTLYERWLRACTVRNDGSTSETTMPLAKVDAVTLSGTTVTCTAGMSHVGVTGDGTGAFAHAVLARIG